jgi:hypothetical protein
LATDLGDPYSVVLHEPVNYLRSPQATGPDDSHFEVPLAISALLAFLGNHTLGVTISLSRCMLPQRSCIRL